MSLARVACVIWAADQAETIAATVTAAATLPGVAIVLVCDDGSDDDTGSRAAAAGAIVVSHQRGRGKAAAVESAVNGLGVLEQRDRRPECGTLLLLDADLGAAAGSLGPVVRSVTGDEADLAVVVPAVPADRPDGADALLATSAARGIAQLTEWTPRAPLSGNRCLTRRAFELASPLAAGFGMEVGMAVDLQRAGLRIVELDLDLPVPPPDAPDLADRLQQAARLRDITRALASRGLVRSGLDEFRSAGGLPGLLNRFKR